MNTLRDFISEPDGSFKRGALARTSQHLGVQPRTVKLWATDEWKPSAAKAREIELMIAAKISLAPDYSRCGRKKGRKRRAK